MTSEEINRLVVQRSKLMYDKSNEIKAAKFALKELEKQMNFLEKSWADAEALKARGLP